MALCGICGFAGETVKIGEICYKLKTPTNPELVPVKHSMFFTFILFVLHDRNSRFNFIFLVVSGSLPQTVAQHLRWIMQKDLLGQDVFLIGPPGPLRRSIAMQYLVSKHNLQTDQTKRLSLTTQCPDITWFT